MKGKYKRAKLFGRLFQVAALYAMAGVGVGSFYTPDSPLATQVAGGVVKGMMYGGAILFGFLATAVALFASDEQIADCSGRVF